MELSIILAASLNGVIGKGNDLPWHIGADLRRFKQLTMGHLIVMGRRTFESIGCLLPGRTSVIVTSQIDWQPDVSLGCDVSECVVTHSWPKTLQYLEAAGDPSPFVIGGAQLFQSAINDVQRFYLTRVLAEVDGDVFLPSLDWKNWELIDRQEFLADQKNDHPYAFENYMRRR